MDWQTLDLRGIPQESGVYGFKSGDRWLYIGQAGNLKQRLNRRQHIPLQIALEMSGIALFYCLTDSPRDLEKRLIRELQPEWNGGTSFEVFGAGSACKSGLENATFEEMDQALSFLTWRHFRRTDSALQRGCASACDSRNLWTRDADGIAEVFGGE